MCFGDILQNFKLPRAPNTPKVAKSTEVITGVYILYNIKTGEVYVGRSCDIFRRISEHKRDIENGNKTVGKAFGSMEDFVFCFIDLAPDSPVDQMRFCEQTVMNVLKEAGYSLINKCKAMKTETYQKMEPKMCDIVSE